MTFRRKLHTGVRGAELLLAEPHHFDLNEKIWKIPALHIKLHLNQNDEAQPITIRPLSRQYVI
jgi:integrase